MTPPPAGALTTSRQELQSCSYRSLQKLARVKGLPANLNKEGLIELLCVEPEKTKEELNAVVQELGRRMLKVKGKELPKSDRVLRSHSFKHVQTQRLMRDKEKTEESEAHIKTISHNQRVPRVSLPQINVTKKRIPNTTGRKSLLKKVAPYTKEEPSHVYQNGQMLANHSGPVPISKALVPARSKNIMRSRSDNNNKQRTMVVSDVQVFKQPLPVIGAQQYMPALAHNIQHGEEDEPTIPHFQDAFSRFCKADLRDGSARATIANGTRADLSTKQSIKRPGKRSLDQLVPAATPRSEANECPPPSLQDYCSEICDVSEVVTSCVTVESYDTPIMSTAVQQPTYNSAAQTLPASSERDSCTTRAVVVEPLTEVTYREPSEPQNFTSHAVAVEPSSEVTYHGLSELDSFTTHAFTEEPWPELAYRERPEWGSCTAAVAVAVEPLPVLTDDILSVLDSPTTHAVTEEPLPELAYRQNWYPTQKLEEIYADHTVKDLWEDIECLIAQDKDHAPPVHHQDDLQCPVCDRNDCAAVQEYRMQRDQNHNIV